VRWWEDIRPGDVLELGSVAVREEELVAFAEAYDPQPSHVDPEAAAQTPFGGLIASGWHTAALFMRLYVRGFLSDTASLGSPGVEELRWLVPVRPGDVLRGRVTILDAWPSERRAGRGTVVTRCEALNQRDEVVMRMTARGHFARRPRPDSTSPASGPTTRA
jgi:acyl dehydratase